MKNNALLLSLFFFSAAPNAFAEPPAFASAPAPVRWETYRSLMRYPSEQGARWGMREYRRDLERAGYAVQDAGILGTSAPYQFSFAYSPLSPSCGGAIAREEGREEAFLNDAGNAREARVRALAASGRAVLFSAFIHREPSASRKWSSFSYVLEHIQACPAPPAR